MLVEASLRGHSHRSRMSREVLPQRFSGQRNARIGETPALSIAQACSTHNAIASAQCSGMTMKRRSTPTISSASSAPSTASGQGSTSQRGGSVLATRPPRSPRRRSTSESSTETRIPISSAVVVRRLSYSSGGRSDSAASSASSVALSCATSSPIARTLGSLDRAAARATCSRTSFRASVTGAASSPPPASLAACPGAAARRGLAGRRA